MIGDVVRPEWVNPDEPWLVEVKPGQWVTATDDDLKAAVMMAMQQANLTGEQLARAVWLLLAQGKIRRNPKADHAAAAA